MLQYYSKSKIILSKNLKGEYIISSALPKLQLPNWPRHTHCSIRMINKTV